MNPDDAGATAAPQHAAAPGSSALAPGDVEKLAEKVYRLLLAEIRLGRARQGGTTGQR